MPVNPDKIQIAIIKIPQVIGSLDSLSIIMVSGNKTSTSIINPPKIRVNTFIILLSKRSGIRTGINEIAIHTAIVLKIPIDISSG